MKIHPSLSALIAIIVFAVSLAALVLGPQSPPQGDVKRGEYLVKGGGCGDCHTPVTMGPAGPGPDTSRTLSGHPQALTMPPVPDLPKGPWLGVVSATFTAWAGPWGVSFTANLTPDRETGLGTWTARTFIDTIRSGRIMAKGRQILPPMPVDAMRNLTDDDLASIFAYLQTVPQVPNRVPEPAPPKEAPVR